MEKRCRNLTRRSLTQEEAETYDRMTIGAEQLELELKQTAINNELEQIKEKQKMMNYDIVIKGYSVDVKQKNEQAVCMRKRLESYNEKKNQTGKA